MNALARRRWCGRSDLRTLAAANRSSAEQAGQHQGQGQCRQGAKQGRQQELALHQPDRQAQQQDQTQRRASQQHGPALLRLFKQYGAQDRRTARGGVVARAAERLRIRRTTLVEKMRKYGMNRRDDDEESSED